MRKISVVIAIAMLVSLLGASTAMAEGPTCSSPELELEVDNHGEHVTRDYVGLTPGESNAKGGAETPGGPGPGAHFIGSVPPGASFCVDANSDVIYEKNPNLPLIP